MLNVSVEKLFLSVFAIGSILLASGCQPNELNQLDVANAEHVDEVQDDLESEIESRDSIEIAAYCQRATVQQITQVNLGVSKRTRFLNKCYSEAGSKKWCDEVARPNPDSAGTFHCTYSVEQAHTFVHPDETTWKHAIAAVKLVDLAG